MLCVVSPAKRLDVTPGPLPEGRQMTRPDFLPQTWQLVQAARQLAVEDLRALMHLSDPLARLNAARFAGFHRAPGPDQALPAIHCFAGDTYIGFSVRTLDPDALRWVDRHLRILSGLYGLLRPWDAIQPHRLEMGSRLANPRGPDLYAFWGDRIARALNAQGQAVGTKTLVNCASVEYFTAANRKALKLRVISPVFLEDHPDGPRIQALHAKRARGAMARFLCETHLTDPADLRGFSTFGYAFQPGLSVPDRPVFLRAARDQDRADAAA
ncbi:peroxide stress protein YaaA [Rhodobacter sp. Har01]|uniref:peroxide stress protein YaaA n=1 Tax=Rhodobacter sp. Har01 TaxID=2883999 RepID=UPI001D086FF4|nr:peroxide stress protein YaaA [Rhodobacter sp. Har01]MCB6177724.1 peroxide stress protein YaaA [Rhodobacter sp. Har01]